MKNDIQDYNLVLKLIKLHGPLGFKDIHTTDPLMLELEYMMDQNDQFFYIGDAVRIKILYTSKRSTKMLGIEPANITLSNLYEATHPDDVQRLSFYRAKVLKMAHKLLTAEKGASLLSTNLYMQNPEGNYSNILIQMYLFYSEIPYKSVFTIKMHTNIDCFGMQKQSHHFYIGSDISLFKYPDEKLLKICHPFSDREFEIIMLIASGLSSQEIAEKVSLSVHTVNTHRRNILKRTDKGCISELIYELMEQGEI